MILTGEALKKENARAISEFFAAQSGKFICASAGPNHECVLAAHGSGAFDASRRDGATVLNVDIGGGTTKLAVVRAGVIGEIAAVNIGARLVAVDAERRIVRLEDAGRTLGAAVGLDLELGTTLSPAEMEALAAKMADVLEDVMLNAGALSPLTQSLMITEPLTSGLSDADQLFFSGGVSEYIYERDSEAYGDLGPLLGTRVRERVAASGLGERLRRATVGIRATVIGAGEYTVQASGTTSYILDRALLPTLGLKALRVRVDDGASPAAAVRRELTKFDLDTYGAGQVIAVQLPDQLDYAALRRFAEGILDIAADAPQDTPLYVTLDTDVAKSLGRILREELGLERGLIVLDGIEIEGDLDYLDIGEPLGTSEVVPVTVKSLVFPTAEPAVASPD